MALAVQTRRSDYRNTMSEQHKNAYSTETLSRADILGEILVAGEELQAGRITRMEYYDEIKKILFGTTDLPEELEDDPRSN